MPRLKVELVNVYCGNTEDIVGADDFYLIGAMVGGGNAKAILTRPVKINNKQTLTFLPEDRVLFEGDIPAGSSIKGGLQAYDEDASRDWTKHGEVIKKISDAVSSAIAATDPQGAIAGTILSTAVQAAAGSLSRVQQDDILGATELEISATGSAREERTWVVRGKGRDWSDWDYKVTYRITRS